MKIMFKFVIAVFLLLFSPLVHGVEVSFEKADAEVLTLFPEEKIEEKLREPSWSFHREISLSENTYVQMAPLNKVADGLWAGLSMYPYMRHSRDQRYAVRFFENRGETSIWVVTPKHFMIQLYHYAIEHPVLPFEWEEDLPIFFEEYTELPLEPGDRRMSIIERILGTPEFTDALSEICNDSIPENMRTGAEGFERLEVPIYFWRKSCPLRGETSAESPSMLGAACFGRKGVRPQFFFHPLWVYEFPKEAQDWSRFDTWWKKQPHADEIPYDSEWTEYQFCSEDCGVCVEWDDMWKVDFRLAWIRAPYVISPDSMPLKLSGWKDLEPNLPEGSTLRDEVHLTRLFLEFLDTEDRSADESETLKALYEWLCARPYPQRYLMTYRIVPRELVSALPAYAPPENSAWTWKYCLLQDLMENIRAKKEFPHE